MSIVNNFGLAAMLLMLVGTSVLSGCANKVCCPVDARELYAAPGEEAVRRSPCGPDPVMYGYRPTTWHVFPGAEFGYTSFESIRIETIDEAQPAIDAVLPEAAEPIGPPPLEPLEMTVPKLEQSSQSSTQTQRSVKQVSFESFLPTKLTDEQPANSRLTILPASELGPSSPAWSPVPVKLQESNGAEIQHSSILQTSQAELVPKLPEQRSTRRTAR